MEIYQIIDSLEDLLEGSPSVPLSGKILVGKEDALEVIRKLRLRLPDEVKAATQVTEERDSIIKMAEIEAQRIIKDAEARFDEMVDDHEIISAAYKKANEIINSAQQKAYKIHSGSYDYVDSILEKVEAMLMDTAETININRNEIQSHRE